MTFGATTSRAGICMSAVSFASYNAQNSYSLNFAWCKHCKWFQTFRFFFIDRKWNEIKLTQHRFQMTSKTDRLLIAVKRLVLLIRSSINRFYAPQPIDFCIWLTFFSINVESTFNTQQSNCTAHMYQLKTKDEKKKKLPKCENPSTDTTKTAAISFTCCFCADWMRFWRKDWLEKVVNCKETNEIEKESHWCSTEN